MTKNNINIKFKNPIEITEVDCIHSTHYMIRFDNYNYLKIYLSPERNCCEKFGMYINFKKTRVFLKSLPLVGAKLNGIAIFDKKIESGFEPSSQKVVLLFTSIGLIFITAFNAHNGYYPHEFEADIKTPELITRIRQNL